ncbi:MAG: hypothetical protein AABY22_33740 [Nanoarchaeota archaeon]
MDNSETFKQGYEKGVEDTINKLDSILEDNLFSDETIGVKTKDKIMRAINKDVSSTENKQDDITPCQKCNCMTKSIREGRAKYVCGKCGTDKSLSDVYWYEATHKGLKQDERNIQLYSKQSEQLNNDLKQDKNGMGEKNG